MNAVRGKRRKTPAAARAARAAAALAASTAEVRDGVVRNEVESWQQAMKAAGITTQ